MEVILKANVAKLGKMLDVVKVKDGFARNFLFPRKLAVLATQEAKVEIEKNREAMEALFQKDHAAAEGVAAKLNQVSINLVRRVVEGERLYGSVTAADLSDALKAQGFKVEKRQIQLADAIKQLGVYTVPVKLFGDVEASVKVWIVKED